MTSDPPSRPSRIRTVRIAGRKFFTRGLAHHSWRDIYHFSMSMSWWWFWGICALAFVGLNAFFGFLYLMLPGSIMYARPGVFSDALFFSIETFSTVGYGDMYPATPYGRFVSMVEVFVGMAVMAIVTGIIFARFARPAAHIIFARNPVIGSYNGQRALMLRMANVRQNDISDAKARLWLVKLEKTMEGLPFRRFYRLKLVHEDNPVFTLGWMICHIIDAHSPFHGETPETLKQKEASLVISLSGLDENAAQDIHRRKIYSYSDIRWNYQYVSISQRDDEGHTHIDYHRFHDMEAETGENTNRE